jgi:hypothetical protein
MDFWLKGPTEKELAMTWLSGLVGVAAPIMFLVGSASGLIWLQLVGGAILVLRDLMAVLLGTLNPVFPVLLALVLAIALSPWYVGVFWASAVFAVLGLPFHVRQVLDPRTAFLQALQRDPNAFLERMAGWGR